MDGDLDGGFCLAISPFWESVLHDQDDDDMCMIRTYDL